MIMCAARVPLVLVMGIMLMLSETVVVTEGVQPRSTKLLSGVKYYVKSGMSYYGNIEPSFLAQTRDVPDALRSRTLSDAAAWFTDYSRENTFEQATEFVLETSVGGTPGSDAYWNTAIKTLIEWDEDVWFRIRSVNGCLKHEWVSGSPPWNIALTTECQADAELKVFHHTIDSTERKEAGRFLIRRRRNWEGDVDVGVPKVMSHWFRQTHPNDPDSYVIGYDKVNWMEFEFYEADPCRSTEYGFNCDRQVSCNLEKGQCTYDQCNGRHGDGLCTFCLNEYFDHQNDPTCNTCLPGYTGDQCKECEPTREGPFPACTSCSEGFNQTADPLCTVCDEDRILQNDACSLCPPGSFANRDTNLCEPCALARSGATCTPCGDDEVYSSGDDGGFCMKCVAGTVPNLNKTECISCDTILSEIELQACPVGAELVRGECLARFSESQSDFVALRTPVCLLHGINEDRWGANESLVVNFGLNRAFEYAMGRDGSLLTGTAMRIAILEELHSQTDAQIQAGFGDEDPFPFKKWYDASRTYALPVLYHRRDHLLSSNSLAPELLCQHLCPCGFEPFNTPEDGYGCRIFDERGTLVENSLEVARAVANCPASSVPGYLPDFHLLWSAACTLQLSGAVLSNQEASVAADIAMIAEGSGSRYANEALALLRAHLFQRKTSGAAKFIPRFKPAFWDAGAGLVEVGDKVDKLDVELNDLNEYLRGATLVLSVGDNLAGLLGDAGASLFQNTAEDAEGTLQVIAKDLEANMLNIDESFVRAQSSNDRALAFRDRLVQLDESNNIIEGEGLFAKLEIDGAQYIKDWKACAEATARVERMKAIVNLVKVAVLAVAGAGLGAVGGSKLLYNVAQQSGKKSTALRQAFQGIAQRRNTPNQKSGALDRVKNSLSIISDAKDTVEVVEVVGKSLANVFGDVASSIDTVLNFEEQMQNIENEADAKEDSLVNTLGGVREALLNLINKSIQMTLLLWEIPGWLESAKTLQVSDTRLDDSLLESELAFDAVIVEIMTYLRNNNVCPSDGSQNPHPASRRRLSGLGMTSLNDFNQQAVLAQTTTVAKGLERRLLAPGQADTHLMITNTRRALGAKSDQKEACDKARYSWEVMKSTCVEFEEILSEWVAWSKEVQKDLFSIVQNIRERVVMVELERQQQESKERWETAREEIQTQANATFEDEKARFGIYKVHATTELAVQVLQVESRALDSIENLCAAYRYSDPSVTLTFAPDEDAYFRVEVNTETCDAKIVRNRNFQNFQPISAPLWLLQNRINGIAKVLDGDETTSSLINGWRLKVAEADLAGGKDEKYTSSACDISAPNVVEGLLKFQPLDFEIRLDSFFKLRGDDCFLNAEVVNFEVFFFDQGNNLLPRSSDGGYVGVTLSVVPGATMSKFSTGSAPNDPIREFAFKSQHERSYSFSYKRGDCTEAQKQSIAVDGKTHDYCTYTSASTATSEDTKMLMPLFGSWRIQVNDLPSDFPVKDVTMLVIPTIRVESDTNGCNTNGVEKNVQYANGIEVNSENKDVKPLLLLGNSICGGTSYASLKTTFPPPPPPPPEPVSPYIIASAVVAGVLILVGAAYLFWKKRSTTAEASKVLSTRNAPDDQ